MLKVKGYPIIVTLTLLFPFLAEGATSPCFWQEQIVKCLPQSGILLENQKQLRLGEATANGSNYVALRGPTSLGANVTLTLPSDDGNADELLVTDGSGGLDFAKVVDANIDNSAAIAYGKLNLSDSIVNNDINSSAAISYSKLNLSSSIINDDISNSAAIAYGKLNLSNSIVNADINSSAAIADTKLATISTAGKVSGDAVTSGTIGGTTAINSTGAIATTGTVTIGSVSPQQPLRVHGTGAGESGTSTPNGVFAVSGSGPVSMITMGVAAGPYTWIQSRATNSVLTFPLALQPTSGSVGIGVIAPTAILGINGNAARTVGLERHTTSNTAGNALTVLAGGATSGATDKNGGNLVLSAGTSTGTGTSSITLQTAPAGSTGTSDNAPTTKLTIAGDGTATFTGQVNLPNGTAGEPALGFASDDDTSGTGLYRVGANNLGFSANGTAVGNISSAGSWTIGNSADTSFAGNAIVGRKNGSTPGAGAVGEVIVPSSSITNTTCGDSEGNITNASLSLTAGRWRVFYSVSLFVAPPTSLNGETGGFIYLTDNSNVHVSGMERSIYFRNIVDTASPYILSTVSAETYLDLSSSATYKLRCQKTDFLGSGSTVTVYNESLRQTTFHAERLP